MPQYADCHLHSVLCGHADNTVAEMVAAIKPAGLIGGIFTEHLPLPATHDPKHEVSMRPEALAPYVATLQNLRTLPNAPQLIVGAEADWLTEDPAWTAASVASARAAGIEVILGSVHMLDGWAFDDPRIVDEWYKHRVEQVWDDYFTNWCRAASSGLFDVMSHPDLVKKFGHVPANPQDYYAEAARTAGEAGVLCEVSTAGLRKPCAELYPAPTFIAELARYGVEFTLASDAHSTAEVGQDFEVAADVLDALNIKRLAFPQQNGDIRWLPLR